MTRLTSRFDTSRSPLVVLHARDQPLNRFIDRPERSLCTTRLRCAWSLRCTVDGEITSASLRGADRLAAQPGQVMRLIDGLH